MSEPDLRYPIGRHEIEDALTSECRMTLIDQIAALPGHARAAAAGLTSEQLATPYRPGGWSVLQVLHHLPDSHLNGYIRFKLALTETVPTIKPYDEAAWAALPDSGTTPLEVSLVLLDALHRRWVEVLLAMKPAEFARTLIHPERGRTFTLDQLLSLYAWHGRHHVAHVTALRTRSGW